MRVERIVFMQDAEARPVLELLDDKGIEETIEHLKQWFNPGEHEVSHCLAAGRADRRYTDAAGFTLTWNMGNEYIGLEFTHK